MVDSSALLAIFFEEPGHERFSIRMRESGRRYVAAPTLVEAVIVIGRRKTQAALSQFDSLLTGFDVEIVPFGAEEAVVARGAFLAFGKGRHPSRLNFGDCMAYAMAKTRGEPLLYKGDDFALTDVAAAL